ncbi:S8 family serine peptidase [Streptomyces sp. NPDC057638]|uniref:S8 family peptidase n=1 Tax=Streptomyces sp. NPDC057638 TaxID=3346190 RepID=UPI0036B56CB0
MSKHRRSKKRIKLTVAAVAAAAATGGSLYATTFAGAAAPPEGTVYGMNAEGAISGSYIVLLEEKADKRKLAGEYGGGVGREYSSTVNGFSATGLSETEAKRLAADPAVAQVVQNRTFQASATQTNPPSWGLDRIDQSRTAGDRRFSYPDTAGQGVTVYVLDSGVRVSHRDFGGRASHGYDAIDRDNIAQDGNGHGTHVAGTIAGGTYGVAKKARIVGVRVLDNRGFGTTEAILSGIDWVAKNRKGPSVANMSLGGGADPALDAAVRRAIASGVTFTVAAGNESRDASQVSPARLREAITVASSTRADGQSSFSNHGRTVDLYAPGSDIVSAGHTSDTATRTMSGTSMAAPHVAGAAALHLAAKPTATPAQVAQALVDGATVGRITNARPGTPNKLLKVAP